MKRKIFCLLLACVLCLGMMPAAASSAGDEAKAAVTAAATVPQSEKRIYKAGTKNPYSSSETVFQPYEFLIDENSRVSANVSVPSANMSGSAVNGEETGEEEPPLDPYKVADVVLDFTDFPTVSEDGSTVSISGDGYIILDGNLIGKIVSSNCTGVFTLEGADYPVSVTLTGETIYITNLNFTIIDYSINENINVHPPLTTGQYNGTLTVAVTMYETFYIHSGQNNQTISFNATVVPPPIMENKAISVIWQDEDNYDQLRPTSIEAIYGGISANLTAPDWNGTITVPEGTAGDWSITKPEGYSCQFSSAGNTTVATLTHSVAPTVTVTAGVAWDDNGNATGAYPDSVSLQLLRDGQPYGDPVTAKAPDWKVTWENLRPYPPAAVSDKPYQYTVVQAEAPANYKLTRNENRILTYTYDPTYTAIWLDGDGKELDKKTYKEGEAEPTTDKVPTKAEDEDNTYAFDKWDSGTVSGTVKTYKPAFTATAKDKPEPAKTEYTVIWLNGDGKELDKKTYKEGEAEPTTDKVPTKAEDEDNTYAFDKWDSGTVSGTVKTYKPAFTATAKDKPEPAKTEYTVIWLNGDGKELDKKTYKEGEAEPTTDKVPTKDEDEDNTYAFDKWDSGTVSGTTKTYKPSFTATAKDKPEPAKTEYTVIWLNGDGSELDKKTYKEGEAEPATDKIPTKAEDAKNTYAFDKWDGGTVSGTVKTYKPIFTATAKPEAPKPAEPNWWYAPENPPAAQPGRVNRVTVDKGIYQLYENTGTAMLVGVMTEKIKDLVIPATVSANGRTYKVTEIDEKACQKLQKLKSVVFGKYIKVIGRKAFYQCAKLKTLTFQGKKLRFIGEKAFKGINKKAVATVPDGWYRPYKKLLRNAGYPENGEIGKEEPAE